MGIPLEKTHIKQYFSILIMKNLYFSTLLLYMPLILQVEIKIQQVRYHQIWIQAVVILIHSHTYDYETGAEMVPKNTNPENPKIT